MILILALSFLSSTAFAADDDSVQTTQTGGQEAVNAIGSLYAAQQAAEARLAAAEAELARKQTCCKAPKAKPAAATPAPAPEPAPKQAEPVVTPAPVADPALEQAKAEAEAAKLAYEQAKAEYEAAKAALGTAPAPVVNVTVTPTPVEVHPVVLKTERTQVEIRTSGFHPMVYAGASLVLGMPIPDVSQGVSGRLTLGVRPTWDLSDHGAFGLSVEADHASGGWGVRGIPQYLLVGNSGEWGVGAGASYNCDGLTDAGCLAEHTGGVIRGSWDKGGRVGGVLVTTDLEFNYVSLPTGNGMETRLILGIHGYLGNTRPAKVTVE